MYCLASRAVRFIFDKAVLKRFCHNLHSNAPFIGPLRTSGELQRHGSRYFKHANRVKQPSKIPNGTKLHIKHQSKLMNCIEYGATSTTDKSISSPHESFEGNQQYNLPTQPDFIDKYISEQIVDRYPEDWSEKFGQLAEGDNKTLIRDIRIEQSYSRKYAKVEPDDEEVVRPLANRRGFRHPYYYGIRIGKLAKQGKIKEAIQVYDDMLHKYRIRPTAFVFSQLISALGQVGYTKKAFQLYQKMKDFKYMPPPGHVITALFNACANSPWPDDGLQRAKHLHMEVIERNLALNSITYNAMIKAFGRCGDLHTAFLIADQMEAVGLTAHDDTYAQLMIAAISDKTAGFKHLVELWRRMRRRGRSPNLHHYNLMLRAMRDCAMGDNKFANELLPSKPVGGVERLLDSQSVEQSVDVPELHYKVPVEHHTDFAVNSISHSSEHATLSLANTSNDASSIYQATGTIHTDRVPVVHQQFNILKSTPDMRFAIELGDTSSAPNRLMLIGGLSGLSRMLKADKVQPDVRTLSLLVGIVSESDEKQLLQLLAEHNVKPDVDFVNALLRKAAGRNDQQASVEYMALLSKLQLQPNVRTFAILAMHKPHKADGLRLLQQCQHCGVTPNLVLFNTLLRGTALNFDYKRAVLKELRLAQLKPDSVTIKTIEQTVALARKIILDKDRHPDSVDEHKFDQQWLADFKRFMSEYSIWLKESKYQTDDPWREFRTTPSDDKSSPQ